MGKINFVELIEGNEQIPEELKPKMIALIKVLQASFASTEKIIKDYSDLNKDVIIDNESNEVFFKTFECLSAIEMLELIEKKANSIYKDWNVNSVKVVQEYIDAYNKKEAEVLSFVAEDKKRLNYLTLVHSKELPGNDMGEVLISLNRVITKLNDSSQMALDDTMYKSFDKDAITECFVEGFIGYYEEFKVLRNHVKRLTCYRNNSQNKDTCLTYFNNANKMYVSLQEKPELKAIIKAYHERVKNDTK